MIRSAPDIDGAGSRKHVFEDGTVLCCDHHGRPHRVDGPAMEFADGRRMWYRHGKLHREDGPAVEPGPSDVRHARSWYLNGKLHREDGPAIEWPNGDRFWFKDGRLHRNDGPAVVYAMGSVSYYLNGQECSAAELTAALIDAASERQEPLAVNDPCDEMDCDAACAAAIGM